MCIRDRDNSLQSVFQSVSDGKKLLATALLTKNVTVADDADVYKRQLFPDSSTGSFSGFFSIRRNAPSSGPEAPARTG